MTDMNGRRLTVPRWRTRFGHWWGMGIGRRQEPSRPIDPVRLARMEAALAQMPDLTREVFMMCRFDDLPYRRIAVRVGISIDEVEAHMARAIKLLGRAARGESV